MKEFKKLIGYESIKVELYRIIDMMTNPENYSKLGVKTTNGLFIYGRPGLGKTLMAKCFIKASKRPSFTIRKDIPDGDFVKYIKATFEKAKKAAPSIVFLDDIDKFANEDNHHRNAEEFITIQSCIDDCIDDEVFVIATANDIECLPDSLLREGRFDKRITLNTPKGKDAQEIVKYYLKQKKVAKDVDYKEVTRFLDGGSCARLEAVINEAGVYSGYAGKEEIDNEDIIKAFMRIVYDAPENLDYKDTKYLRNTAIHEAGHTVVSEILEPESINVVTVRRHLGEIGGFTSFERDEDYFESKHFMENRVMSLLAGKAATEVIFGTSDVGAGDDLKRAFKIVLRFVDEYCGYGFDYMDSRTSMQLSSTLLDRKTQLMQTEMERYYQKAKKIIIENRELLLKLTDALVEKKTIVYSDIQAIKKELGYTC